MDHITTDFSVDSSSRFPFKARTGRHTVTDGTENHTKDATELGRALHLRHATLNSAQCHYCTADELLTYS